MKYRYNGSVMDERMDVFLNMLYGDEPEYLRDIASYAEDIHAPVMRKQTAQILRFFINKDNVSSILEIGTAIGYSALFMAEFGTGIKIDTIEKVPARIKDARNNFEKYDVNKCIKLIEGDAAGVLDGLVRQNKSYDLIFLDAAKAQYMRYLFFMEKLMGKGAVLITDNVLQEGELLESRYAVNRRDRTIHSRMREFLKEITDNTKWNTIVLPVGDGVAVSTRNHIPERLD